jgi:hypothetical protein
MPTLRVVQTATTKVADRFMPFAIYCTCVPLELMKGDTSKPRVSKLGKTRCLRMNSVVHVNLTTCHKCHELSMSNETDTSSDSVSGPLQKTSVSLPDAADDLSDEII